MRNLEASCVDFFRELINCNVGRRSHEHLAAASTTVLKGGKMVHNAG